MCTDRNREMTERYEGSGLSQKDFADQEGIGVSTLNYHLKRARANTGKGFTHLEVRAPQGRMVITTSGGTTIEIPL